MGEGNPNRQRRIGRGAEKGWKMEKILESGLASPKPSAQKRREKKADVINLNAKRPVDATKIHSGPSISKPVGKISASRIEPAKLENNNTYLPEEDLEHWTGDDGKMLKAVAEVLDQASDAELVEVERRLNTEEFNETERSLFVLVAENYHGAFLQARKKREDNGGITDEEWAFAFRQSYVEQQKGKNIAPEKAEFLEKYLELKLPVGLIEENFSNSSGKTEEKKEVPLTSEQRGYIDNVMIFLKKLSMGILEIAAKKEGRELNPNELKNCIGSSMKDLKQKYFINQPGYVDVFYEGDLDKIVNMAVAKHQKDNK